MMWGYLRIKEQKSRLQVFFILLLPTYHLWIQGRGSDMERNHKFSFLFACLIGSCNNDDGVSRNECWLMMNALECKMEQGVKGKVQD